MAKNIKKCAYCGNEFESRNENNKFCSSVCCSKHRQALRKEYLENNIIEYIKDLYRKYHKGALSRKIEFNLSADTFELFVGKNCYYCGDKINSVGIDRIDSKKGYVVGNIISCCRTCNIMKLALPQEVFLAKIKQIHDHLKL